jgi:hypothetical protein
MALPGVYVVSMQNHTFLTMSVQRHAYCDCLVSLVVATGHELCQS